MTEGSCYRMRDECVCRLMDEQLPCLERVLLRMSRDIASGLDYLSSKSFVHRVRGQRDIMC